ncbi:MAG: DUF99 family protein [Candidatus Thorarchaeota archaeon]
MKKQSRWLSLAGGKVDFVKKPRVPICGILTRGTYLEHFFLFWVDIDPIDITKNIIEQINNESWYNNSIIQGFWFHGLTIAGFGIIDLNKLQNEYNKPVISLTDEPPDSLSIKKALLSKLKDGRIRWELLQNNSSNPVSLKKFIPDCNLWITCNNISLPESINTLKNQRVYGCLPEGLRMVRIIAQNIDSLIN